MECYCNSCYSSDLTFIYSLLILQDAIQEKLAKNNIFTVAKRHVEGQDMLYQSMKLVNNVEILAELKVQPGNPTLNVSLLSLWVSFHPLD